MNKPVKPPLGPPVQIAANGPIVSRETLARAGGDALRGPQYTARPELVEAAKHSAAISGLAAVHAYYRDGFMKTIEALQTDDPTKTREGNFIDINARATRFLDEAGKRGTAATNAAKQAVADIDAEIDRSLPTSDHVRAGEIRNHFKNLTKEQRISLAVDAIQKNDRETIAALLTGPVYLTGLTDEHRDMIRARYAETHMPEKLTLRKALEMALAINDEAFNQLLFAINDQLFPRDKIAEISRKREAAKLVKDAIFKV